MRWEKRSGVEEHSNRRPVRGECIERGFGFVALPDCLAIAAVFRRRSISTRDAVVVTEWPAEIVTLVHLQQHLRGKLCVLIDGKRWQQVELIEAIRKGK